MDNNSWTESQSYHAALLDGVSEPEEKSKKLSSQPRRPCASSEMNPTVTSLWFTEIFVLVEKTLYKPR